MQDLRGIPKNRSALNSLVTPVTPHQKAGSRRVPIVDPLDPDRPLILLVVTILVATVAAVTLALAYAAIVG